MLAAVNHFQAQMILLLVPNQSIQMAAIFLQDLQEAEKKEEFKEIRQEVVVLLNLDQSHRIQLIHKEINHYQSRLQ